MRGIWYRFASRIEDPAQLTGGGILAIITSTASGDWNVGGTWVGGVAPGSLDDAIIANTHVVTLTAHQTTGSCEIQAGGTLAGGGFELTCNNKNGAGFAFDNDGTISGVLDLILIGPAAQIDLVGTGNVNNLSHTDTITFVGDTVLDGSYSGLGNPFRPNADADTLTVGGNVNTPGTIGSPTWTGDFSIGGDVYIGTYSHGNQQLLLEGAGAQAILSALSVYHLNLNNSNTTTVSGVDLTATYVIEISGGNTLSLSDTTVTLGTASASGAIACGGTLLVGDATKIYAANSGYYANLQGTGTFDWDYSSTGTIYWKWLTHKGTNATAKTTGGSGITVQMDGQCNFTEDFTVAANDTLDQNDNIIGIKKNLTITGDHDNGAELYLLSAGTGVFSGYSGTDLTIYTDSEYSFDGTNAFSGAVTWDGASVGDLLAYDAGSILNVTGGITVPATAYFGADSSADMGDGNDATGWAADQSWGWFNNSGTMTLPRADLTLTSQSGGDAIDNSGTLTHNNCVIILNSSTAHQGISNSANDDLYRVDNQNTYSSTVTFNHDTDLDGIWFTTGTVTEAANGVTVTLTGYTPALGSVGPFTHDLLETSGRLLETGTGTFVFNHELPADTTLYVYRVLRGSSEADQLGVDDVYVKKAENKYDREARIYLDDYDGGQADNWKYTQGVNTYYYGSPVHILYHDGTEWKTLWKGFMSSRDSQGTGTGVVIHCFSYDQWLKARTVDIAFTHRNHTLKEIAQQLITKYTPVEYVDANMDLSSNPSTLQMTFQGVTVDEALSTLLEKSADEEFGVNSDMEFYTRQRATSHDGTNDAPVDFTTNWYDYSFERVGSTQTNRVEVYYGTSLDNMAVADNRTAQTEMQTETGAAQPIIITLKVSRPDIQLLVDAQSYADWLLNGRTSYWKGQITTYGCEDCDPGMVTEVTIAEMDELSGTVAFKIEVIEYSMSKDETVLYMQEPDKIPNYKRALGNLDDIAARSTSTNIQMADTTFEMQSTSWDTQADFNLWALGANQATHASGYIYCTGATVGVETCTSPWVTPGTGKDAVSFWQDMNEISENEGGSCVVDIEGSVSGLMGPFTDWSDISGSFANDEDVRLVAQFNWDGITGISPKFHFGRIRHK